MLKKEHLKIDSMSVLGTLKGVCSEHALREHAQVRKVAFSIQCMKEHVNF